MAKEDRLARQADRRQKKLDKWQRKVEQGRAISDKKVAKLGAAQAALAQQELEKPLTRADFTEAQEDATADVGAMYQAQMAGQPMGMSNQPGQLVQQVRRMREGMSGDVLQRAVSEVDLKEQIREKRLAAKKAEYLKWIAMKSANKKQQAQMASMAMQGSMTQE
tara:strand:- start:2482 stop:2973 length:492 start_codon:yes stop_codon:yes gene_type:complete